jgi:hypothetical protein
MPAEKEHLEIEDLKQGQRIGGSGQPAEQFGMADVLDAGGLEGFLVDRGGGQRVCLIGLAQRHRPFDEFVGGAAGRRLHLAERHPFGVHIGQIHQIDDARLIPTPSGVGDDLNLQIQAGDPQGPAQGARLADHQRARVGVNRWIRQRLDHDFRADAGDVAQRNADNAASHVVYLNGRVDEVVRVARTAGGIPRPGQRSQEVRSPTATVIYFSACINRRVRAVVPFIF